MEKMHDLIRTNVMLQNQLHQHVSHTLELNGFLNTGVSTLTSFPTPERLMGQFRSLMTTNRIDVLEAWKLDDEEKANLMSQDLVFMCFETGTKVREAYERLCTKLTHRLPPLDMIITKEKTPPTTTTTTDDEKIITGVTGALMAYLRHHYSGHIPHAHALNRHVRSRLPDIGGHIQTVRFVRTMLDFAWQVVLCDPPLMYRRHPETRAVELFLSATDR